MDTSEQVKKLINLTKTIRSVLNLIGWWTPLLSIVGALGWTTWAWFTQLPLPNIVAGFICVSVAVAYAAVFPKVVSLLLRGAVYRKPDYDLWAVSPILHIRQAACLFADVHWVEGGKVPLPEKARIWAHHIAIAVETRRLQNMSDVAS